MPKWRLQSSQKTNKNKHLDSKIPNIKIDNNIIDRVTAFNFLGITLHENLNWGNHIDNIATKVSRNVGLMKHLKKFVPLSTLRHIYTSLILSIVFSKVCQEILKGK